MRLYPWLEPIQKKLKNGFARGKVEIKCAVHKLELLDSTLPQAVQVSQKGCQRNLPHRNVQGGKAKFARKGATARGFDVNDAMGDVLLSVEIIWQNQL